MNSTVTSVAPPSPRTWSGTITLSHIEKKAQQRLYFLDQLRKFNLPQELLKKLYSSLSKKLKSSLNLVQWIATKSDHWRIRRVVRTAERTIGTSLTTLQELYLFRVSKRAGKITLDPSHPAHSLFELLPSGQRYRALSTRTTRHRNSLFPLSNPSHEHLTIIMVHTLFIHLFI